MTLLEALRIANAPPEGPPFSILLACGFTPLHLETALKAHLRVTLPGRTIDIRTGLYGDLAGTLENALEKPDVAIVVIEWADLDPRLGWRSMGIVNEAVIADVQTRVDRISGAIASMAGNTPVVMALPGLPIAPALHTPTHELNSIEARLREMIYRLAASTPATVLDPASLPHPRHDLRSELMSGFPYSFLYADALAERLVRLAFPPAPKKGLITDLDGTLWSGVLGDDGLDGISWDLDRKTQFHALYQQMLNNLAASGALIGIASKNDEALVRKALEKSDLIVNPQHLFPVEAHWQPKIESIGRALEAWNIGADSVVFVDDDPIELEQVKTAFPAMECIAFRRDDPEFLLGLRNRFAKRAIRTEDLLRTQSLRAAQTLRSARTNRVGLDEVLKGAEGRLRFRWSKEPPDPRALELINKTNQFNLNGRRYTEADWRRFLSDRAVRLIMAEYEDRFGKLGKIAVLAGREQNGSFRIESWVMSCRAFSRRIEHHCLKAILERWEQVTLAFEPTERNGPLRDFLSQIGAASSIISRADFERRCPPLFHETESLDV